MDDTKRRKSKGGPRISWREPERGKVSDKATYKKKKGFITRINTFKNNLFNNSNKYED